jgi:hypothetical protein
MTIRMIEGRRMQCKDIPDGVFVAAVRLAPSIGGYGGWRMRWDVQPLLEEQLGPIPERLFLAKAAKLIDRGLLGGCPCGCRGDFHPADECTASDCCGNGPLDQRSKDAIGAVTAR